MELVRQEDRPVCALATISMLTGRHMVELEDEYRAITGQWYVHDTEDDAYDVRICNYIARYIDIRGIDAPPRRTKLAKRQALYVSFDDNKYSHLMAIDFDGVVYDPNGHVCPLAAWLKGAPTWYGSKPVAWRVLELKKENP